MTTVAYHNHNTNTNVERSCANENEHTVIIVLYSTVFNEYARTFHCVNGIFFSHLIQTFFCPRCSFWICTMILFCALPHALTQLHFSAISNNRTSLFYRCDTLTTRIDHFNVLVRFAIEFFLDFASFSWDKSLQNIIQSKPSR